MHRKIRDAYRSASDKRYFVLRARAGIGYYRRIMSEEVLRSYRLTSMEEPTDEMLHAIMEKVAEAARESTRKANEAKHKLFAEMQSRIRERKQSLL